MPRRRKRNYEPGESGERTLPANYSSIKTHARREAPRRRPRDWVENEARQRRRYTVELLVNRELLEPGNWLSEERSGRRGRPRVFSDAALLACLQLAAILRLPLRGAEHFAASLLALAGAEVLAPDHVTLARARLRLGVPALLSTARGGVVVVDGTGLATRKRGAWRAHKWGVSTGSGDAADAGFLRLSVALDYESGEFVGFTLCEPAGAGSGESSQLRSLLAQAGAGVAEVIGDGAYDTRGSYRAAGRAGARLLAPPRGDAAYGMNELRDAHLKTIAWHGEAEWRRRVDYGRRSAVEAAFARLKRLTGERLTTRLPEARRAEVAVRLWAANEALRPRPAAQRSG